MHLKVASANAKVGLDRIRANEERALGVVAYNVLSDCSDFIPYKTGAMKNSGRAFTNGGHGYVSWGEGAATSRYTRKQYYDTSLDHDTDMNAQMSPNATAKWFEEVKLTRLDAWIGMLKHVLKGGK